MESICVKLDETLLDFFDILEQLYQQQAHLGDLMKSGFLDLSRSRYNMGTKFVTPAQFNEDEMKALVKLEIQQDNGNTVLGIIHQDSDKKKTNEESNLRKRNVVNDDDKGNKMDVETIGLGDISTDENKSGTDGRDKKSTVDPINWFGVLVPQNLRRSQSSFKAAIDVSVTVANLKLRLQELKITYRKLLADKEELLKKEKEEIVREEKGVES